MWPVLVLRCPGKESASSGVNQAGMSEEPHNPNPIVDLAMRLRARRDLNQAVEASSQQGPPPPPGVATEERLRSFADGLAGGIKKLNAILGQKNGATLVRLEKPFRIALRFREKRVTIRPAQDGQYVRITGAGWDDEYGFEPSTNALFPRAWFEASSSPSVSQGEALTPSSMLRELTRDAMLPPPAPPEIGPLQL